jgi:hypothetical protein
MPDYRKIDVESERIFESVLDKIQGQLEIKRQDSGVGLGLLLKFEELNKYKSLFVHKVTELKGKNNSFILLLVEKHLTILKQKKHGRVEKDVEEVEPVIIFPMPVDIGKVYIRTETLADKIADIFYEVDIDFDDYKNFSNNYYLIGDHPDLIRKHIPLSLIESLNTIQDMTVEINGPWGLLRPEKNLNEDLLLLLINMGYIMTK